MIVKKEITERKCCFYASDFHLEMTIVPYIDKKIKENKNVIIITQNKLEDSIKILISRMNMKNKQYILKIDWNNDDISKIQSINDIVIINGNKKFIENKNEEIKKMLGKLPNELIDCYLFDEIKNEIVEIKEEHTGVLNNLQKDY